MLTDILSASLISSVLSSNSYIIALSFFIFPLLKFLPYRHIYLEPAKKYLMIK